jgi:signal transduction histidine kinase/phage shock protein PspC (stress-responsive transcriptional regulator)
MGAVSTTVSPAAPAQAAAVRLVVGPPRPPLLRPREDRMLGGVAHGLADHLGLTVPAARILLLASCLTGGFGGFLYLWLWALVPSGPVAPPGPGRPERNDSFKQQVGAMKAVFVQGRHGAWSAAVFARPGTTPPPFTWTRPAAPPVVPPGAPPVPPTSATQPTGTAPAPPATWGPGAPTATSAATVTPGPAVTAPAVPPGPQVPAPPPIPPLPPIGPAAAAAATGYEPPPPSVSEPPPPGAEAPARRGRVRRGDLLAGALLVLAGGVLLFSRQGWATNPGFVLPLLVVGAGAIIAYAQLDEVERNRWAERSGVGTRRAVLRIIGGLVLVVFGILLLVVQEADVGQLGRTLLAALAVLAGSILVLAPWGLRMWRDLDDERAARIRESERADIAAHLHDSVLQTLALIQRKSADSAEVMRLARAQERDLRGWLYGASAVDPSTLAARVAAVAAEAEDVHGAVVEVVTVGDRPVDERTRALLAALREAVFNAARHAGAPVQVYVESGPSGVEAFVRDRGVGFDLAAVPEDRLGVRESVIGRMERHGGNARVTSAHGDGTEVRLLMPDEEEVPT